MNVNLLEMSTLFLIACLLVCSSRHVSCSPEWNFCHTSQNWTWKKN